MNKDKINFVNNKEDNVKKVFLVHDMNGYDKCDIELIRSAMKREVTKIANDENWIPEFIDNYNHENVPDDAGRLWHLGESIKLLDKADYIVIPKAMSVNNGCIIEQIIARFYNLNIIYVKGVII